MFTTGRWRETVGEPGGNRGLGDALARPPGPGVGADVLAAGVVDHMHIVVVPSLLSRGARLWEGLEGLEKDYQVEATSSPSGVTHVTFTRAGVSRSGAHSSDRRREHDPPR